MLRVAAAALATRRLLAFKPLVANEQKRIMVDTTLKLKQDRFCEFSGVNGPIRYQNALNREREIQSLSTSCFSSKIKFRLGVFSAKSSLSCFFS